MIGVKSLQRLIEKRSISPKNEEVPRAREERRFLQVFTLVSATLTFRVDDLLGSLKRDSTFLVLLHPLLHAKCAQVYKSLSSTSAHCAQRVHFPGISHSKREVANSLA